MKLFGQPPTEQPAVFRTRRQSKPANSSWFEIPYIVKIRLLDTAFVLAVGATIFLVAKCAGGGV